MAPTAVKENHYDVRQNQYDVRENHYDVAQMASRPPTPPAMTPEIESMQYQSVPTTPLVVRRRQIEKDQEKILLKQRPADKFQVELTETLKKPVSFTGSRASLAKMQSNETFITDSSEPEQVRVWLEEKGFSDRTIRLLSGQRGDTLFSLTRHQLQNFCGKEEGQRLYSFLLVQKSISGYDTSDKQLEAALALRKRQTEEALNNTDAAAA